MKSIVLLVAVLAVSGVAQGADHALWVLGSASSSGFATPSGAETPVGKRSGFPSERGVGHRKTRSDCSGISFDESAPTRVTQQPAAAQLELNKNLVTVESFDGKNKPKGFMQSSALKSECAGCLPPVAIGLLFLCEKLVWLGVL